MSAEAEDPLTAAHFDRARAQVYARTGMQFGAEKRYFVERRLRDRMAANAIRTFAHYFAVLGADAVEAEALINSFTINETYFYREAHQFQCMGADLLPEIAAGKTPGDKIRIWSIPCSTGEEPYSIALWLLENWRLVDAYHVEIVGSDIDTRALEQARLGLFGRRSLTRLPAAVTAGYFEERDDDQFEIIDDIKQSVIFTHANVVDEADMRRHGKFDIIFCRNVLIYFDDASRRAAAANILGALNDGGFACLGHTESMTRILDSFLTRRFADAIVYQRAGGRR